MSLRRFVMRKLGERLVVSTVMLATGGAATSCGDDKAPGAEASLAALMDDGDAARVAPDAMRPPPAMTPPPRFCPARGCAGSPLAFWTLDDCNTFTTELADSAFTSIIRHEAFRAVSVACTPGIDGQGVRLASDGDIVYAPDQPDFVFDQ